VTAMPNKADIPKYQTVEDWLAALPVRLRAKLAGKVSMEPEGMIVVVKDGTLSDKEIAKLYSKATHNNPVRIGRATFLGWAPDDDPIYTNAGWNFVMGKNLNPKR
jgi:hypothetical protein